MAERAPEIKPKGFKESALHFLSKGSEFSKKLDIIVFAAGGVVFLFSPPVGLAIIGGNAVTFIGADEVQRRAKWKLEEKQAQRLSRQGGFRQEANVSRFQPRQTIYLKDLRQAA